MTIGVLVSLLICLPAPAVTQVMTGTEVNVVKSIRASGFAIEIEVHSSTKFPVRGEVVVLAIGKKEFSKSKPAPDGSLNTLIFVLDPEEFEKLPEGEPMTVSFGRQTAEEGMTSMAAARAPRADKGPRWKFGTLNKALLSR